MLETKEQKQIFAGSLVLILILGVISIWGHPSFNPQNNTDYAALKQKSDAQQKAYNDFLASVGTDPAAQQQLYQQIIPPDELKQEIADQLQTDQKITVPDKPQTPIKVSSAAGGQAVADFLNSTNPILDKIQQVSDASQNDLFNQQGSVSQMDSLISDLGSSLSSYSKLPVPKEAVDFENHQLVVFETYLDLAKISKAYMQGTAANPWPEMYKDYAIMSEASVQADTSFQSLNKKYNLLGDSQNSSGLAKGNFLVPAAQAQFGGIVVDIFAKAEEIARIAAATAVARFMLAFLDQLANKIQQTYTISNYLYYTDALVSGRYVDDYLNKYVNDPLDRTMVKNFIPAISCGGSQDLQSVYEAKAAQYLGFDPNSLDPNDPDYYQKLARVGNFFSSPQGWENYYQDLAGQAQSAAEQAANNELNSQGYKSSRDIFGNIIQPAVDTINSMRAVLQSELAFGIPGTSGDPFTAKIATTITNQFLNTFVFKGTVLQEQKACIAVPVSTIVTSVPVGTAPDVQPANP